METTPRWTVCCSGGGIRSAAYCLGGLQRLAEQPGGNPDLVVGVSGGSYIAAARALAAHERPDEPPYAAGSDLETRLRGRSHYLAPGPRVWIAAVLSLLSGAAAISVVMLAPVVLGSYAWGRLLGATGVLRPAGDHLAVDLAPWCRWAAVVAAVAAGVGYLIWRIDRAHRQRWTPVLGGTVAAAVTTVLLVLAVPALIGLLSRHTDLSGLRTHWLSATGLAVVSTLVAAVDALATALRTRVKLDKDQQAAVVRGLGSIGGRLRRVLPWAATVAMLLLVAVAALSWAAAAVPWPWGRPTWLLLAGAAVVPLGARLFVELNRLSMHDFYRWRLADAYGGDRPETPLSELRGSGLVIGAAVNVTAEGARPPGQGSCLLTFDPDRVTLHPAGPGTPAVRAATADLELLVGRRRMTLFNVAAISGAAVAPVMGSQTRPAFRLPMVVANVRLGLWLPNPAIVSGARDRLDHPRPGDSHTLAAVLPLWARYVRPWHRHGADRADLTRRLWAHVLWLRERAARPGRRWPAAVRAAVAYQAMQPTLGLLWRESVGRLDYRETWMYATDGGHYDNLGLIPALHRRARRILVLDASGDRSDHWSTIGGTQALARTDAGTEIDLDPSVMRPAGTDLAPREVVRPWARGRFLLPRDTVPGHLWVCKLGWWRRASWDVRAFAAAHPRFPNKSTGQQLYDGAEFEAYRALGYESVAAVLAEGDLAGELLPAARPSGPGLTRAAG